MPMRIAIVMPPLLPMPPVRGGAVEALVDSILRENERVGQLEVTVFCRYDRLAAASEGLFKNTRFRTHVVHGRVLRAWDLLCRGARKLFRINLPPQLPYLGWVLRQLRRDKWDRVVVENVAEYTLPVMRACGAPVYLHMHNRYLRPDLWWSEAIVASDARIIPVSDFLLRDVLAVPGVRPDRVRVLLNCVDVKRFRQSGRAATRRDVRARQDISQDAFVFLYTGRVLPEKGVLELLEAFLRLKDERAYLLVVGSSWFSSNTADSYMERLRALSEGCARVTFTGFVSYEGMPGIYSAADVACVPSIWEEPAGLTALEAMAAGLPLITTGAGGIPEYISEGSAILTERGDGLTDRLENAMRTLLADPALCAKMSEAALRGATDRDESRYYRSFCSLLRDFHGEDEA